MKKIFLAGLLFFGCSTSEYDEQSITGEIVVDFKDNVDVSYINELGNKLSIKFAPNSDYTDIDKIYTGHYYGVDKDDVLDSLRGNSHVESAEAELLYSIPERSLLNSDEGLHTTSYPVKQYSFPNDPLFNEQWNFKQVHLPNDWTASAGNNVIVAVIDTGVSRVTDMKQTKFVKGWNFVSNKEDTEDDNGHGTHVAGTIAQSTNNGIGVAGIAFNATIMPVKVLNADGSGTSASIAEGIRFATDKGAKVINLSLGGSYNSPAMEHAVKYAFDHGVTVVCAAGNSARDKVSYPAANPGAIAVAATQQNERTTFYSNWGKEIAIAAPGGNIRESDSGGILQNTVIKGKDDYYYFMGTSMAAPHIAGIAAMIISQGVSEPSSVKQILVATARAPSGMDTRPKDYAEHYGAGLVDASKAIKMAQSLESHPNKTHYGLYVLLLGLIVLTLYVWLKKRK